MSPRAAKASSQSKGLVRAAPIVCWIDASKQLPDDEITVLIALSDGEVWTGFHDAGVWRFVSGDEVDQSGSDSPGIPKHTVTHWAEFPEPPNMTYETEAAPGRR